MLMKEWQVLEEHMDREHFSVFWKPQSATDPCHMPIMEGRVFPSPAQVLPAVPRGTASGTRYGPQISVSEVRCGGAPACGVSRTVLNRRAVNSGRGYLPLSPHPPTLVGWALRKGRGPANRRPVARVVVPSVGLTPTA